MSAPLIISMNWRHFNANQRFLLFSRSPGKERSVCSMAWLILPVSISLMISGRVDLKLACVLSFQMANIRTLTCLDRCQVLVESLICVAIEGLGGFAERIMHQISGNQAKQFRSHWVKPWFLNTFNKNAPIHQVFWGLQQMWISIDLAEHIGAHLLHHIDDLVELEWFLTKVGIHFLARRL